MKKYKIPVIGYVTILTQIKSHVEIIAESEQEAQKIAEFINGSSSDVIDDLSSVELDSESEWNDTVDEIESLIERENKVTSIKLIDADIDEYEISNE